MTGSVYFSCSSANKQMRFHVNGIERVSRLDLQTSLHFIQWQTYSETRYTHCSGEKQNSSKRWINLTSYDTFNQTVKHSVTLLTLCVRKFCILMSSKLLYPRISRTPNFERFFLEKSAAYTRENTVHVSSLKLYIKGLVSFLRTHCIDAFRILKRLNLHCQVAFNFEK